MTFGDDESKIIQYQKIPRAVNARGIYEVRETPWTKEQSSPGHPYNPGRRWFEMVRIVQPYSPEATWTFGYEFAEDGFIASSQAKAGFLHLLCVMYAQI